MQCAWGILLFKSDGLVNRLNWGYTRGKTWNFESSEGTPFASNLIKSLWKHSLLHSLGKTFCPVFYFISVSTLNHDVLQLAGQQSSSSSPDPQLNSFLPFHSQKEALSATSPTCEQLSSSSYLLVLELCCEHLPHKLCRETPAVSLN